MHNVAVGNSRRLERRCAKTILPGAHVPMEDAAAGEARRRPRTPWPADQLSPRALIPSSVDASIAHMTGRPLDLLQGTLDVLVLRALSRGPMHGYAVARFIHAGSDGTFTVVDGALYTSLHRMEERGWVESEWGTSEKGRRAKFYRLTTAGRRALRDASANWNAYVTAVASVMRASPEPA